MSADQIVAGRYRLAERLGGGGMGVVWQAHDERLRRTVAVKQVIMPPSLDDARLEEIRKRTMREGRIAAKLHHPQLITVYDVVEDDGRPYLVMEYLPSKSLSKKLAEDGPLPPAEVARIGAQAAAALASAHAAGVVHRDVKPGNILVGDNGTVKITDFGVSRVVEDVTGTATGTFVGTPAYLAPEVAQGKDVTFASDVYSLGATLYTAVEGSSPAGPTDKNPMLLLHRIASGAVNPPQKAGPLNDILLRMLSTDPEQRPTMDQARAELQDIADGRTAAAAPTAATAATAPTAPPAQPAAAATPAGERPHRRRAVALLAAVCVLVAIATTLVVLNANDNGRTAGTAAPSSAKASTGAAASSAPAQPEEPATTTAPTTTTAPPAASTPPKTPQQPGNPVAAVTGYYALMPGNPDAGWQRLTPKFQRSPAGGPDGYRRYWNSISAVSASGASGSGSTVTVTVNYTFKSGRKVRELHRYTLVNQGGRWLIDTVAVLSSTDLR